MTASQTTPQARTPCQRGFPALPCILCGNAGGTVTVSLYDVSRFHCNECDEDFNADDVTRHIAKWQAVLAWSDAAPIVVE